MTQFSYILSTVIHLLPLLREEFRLPKLTFHSDLRRRAASRRALPRTSSLCLLTVLPELDPGTVVVRRRRRR